MTSFSGYSEFDDKELSTNSLSSYRPHEKFDSRHWRDFRSVYVKGGKRAFDLVIGSFIAVAVLPLMLVLLAAVAIEGGAPIFSHRRVGRNGKDFACLKFRTMVPDAETRLLEVLQTDPAAAAEWALDRKLRNDPRISPLGRMLRKTSLDELPQIWNVLKGEMTLVGPRPITREELTLYGSSATAYQSVRPGITGIWQVSGRNNYSYAKRVQLDGQYVLNYSFVHDLYILARTLPAVLRLTGC